MDSCDNENGEPSAALRVPFSTLDRCVGHPTTAFYMQATPGLTAGRGTSRCALAPQGSCAGTASKLVTRHPCSLSLMTFSNRRRLPSIRRRRMWQATTGAAQSCQHKPTIPEHAATPVCFWCRRVRVSPKHDPPDATVGVQLECMEASALPASLQPSARVVLNLTHEGPAEADAGMQTHCQSWWLQPLQTLWSATAALCCSRGRVQWHV